MTFPQLDHYFGRSVVDVYDHKLGWVIELEQGVEIVITDPVTERDDSLKGLDFVRQDLSGEGTTLHFGSDADRFQKKVIFRPDRYAISSPHYNSGQLVNPQQPVEVAHVQRIEGAYAPAAPGERVVEGPSEEAVGSSETMEDDEEGED